MTLKDSPAYKQVIKRKNENSPGKAAYEKWASLHAPFATTWERLPQRSVDVWHAVATAAIMATRRP